MVLLAAGPRGGLVGGQLRGCGGRESLNTGVRSGGMTDHRHGAEILLRSVVVEHRDRVQEV